MYKYEFRPFTRNGRALEHNTAWTFSDVPNQETQQRTVTIHTAHPTVQINLSRGGVVDLAEEVQCKLGQELAVGHTHTHTHTHTNTLLQCKLIQVWGEVDLVKYKAN